jgi:hypothetical protein
MPSRPYLSLSAFLTASRVVIIPNVWLNWTNLSVQNFEKVEMWISRFLRRKSQLSLQNIVYYTILFPFENKNFNFFHIQDCILCKHSVRFSPIVSRGLDGRFLVPLYLTFRFTLYI